MSGTYHLFGGYEFDVTGMMAYDGSYPTVNAAQARATAQEYDWAQIATEQGGSLVIVLSGEARYIQEKVPADAHLHSGGSAVAFGGYVKVFRSIGWFAPNEDDR